MATTFGKAEVSHNGIEQMHGQPYAKENEYIWMGSAISDYIQATEPVHSLTRAD